MAAPETIVIRSYAGGELTPSLYARADLAKYQIGLKTCRNFLVQRHGGAANRPGTRLVERCKTDDFDITLARYVSEIPEESVLIEFGELYFRFYQQGAIVELAGVAAYNGATAYEIGDIVVSGGTNYYAIAATTGNAPPNATFWYAMPGDVLEIPHPFTDPRQTHWVQSGRIITFTHRDFPPHDLVHFSLTRWAIVELDTAPKVTPPQNPVLTVGAAGARAMGYVITAAHPVTFEESEPSAQVINAACADPSHQAPNVLSWDVLLTPPVTGDPSPEYYVYCDADGNGTYGFIGVATGAATFNDPGITPDYTRTPPQPQTKFAASGEYPQTCAYHQQRRWFGHSEDVPDAIFASKTGYPDNFDISSPLQDDDAITARIAGNNHHAVRRLIALKNLLVMTDGGEWRLVGPDNGIVTPNSIDFDQETYVGIARDVAPIIIGNSIIYLQARQSIIRDLSFNQEVEGLAGKDLTVYATHLFEGRTIRSIDYAQVPESVVWAVRSDGSLLGLTYVKEQDVMAWHRHDTNNGDFECVCVVPEPGEDGVYFIVERNGHRYIEQLASRSVLTFDVDAFFVDSGLSYSGAPTQTFGGLSHLEGMTVRAVGDGVDLGTFVVSGGNVTIPVAASNVHIGLPIVADFETMDLDVPSNAVRTQQQRQQHIHVIISASNREFSAGPDVDHLTRYVRSAFDDTDKAFTGQIEMSVGARWKKPTSVFIRQDKALPLTILGVAPATEIGG